MTDYDFAEEFSASLATILGQPKPYKVRWHARKNRWVVKGSSILLYKFLNCDWKSLKKWIEHCDNCWGAFLRAFYDSEGSIIGSLVVSNTRRELLGYLQTLLKKAHIETTSLLLGTSAGTKLKDPRTGRIYVRKKDCFRFTVRTQSIPRFEYGAGGI